MKKINGVFFLFFFLLLIFRYNWWHKERLTTFPLDKTVRFFLQMLMLLIFDWNKKKETTTNHFCCIPLKNSQYSTIEKKCKLTKGIKNNEYCFTLWFIFYTIMHLGIHLFCRRSHLYPGQNDVSLILKHLCIYLMWRLTFKKKNTKKEKTNKQTKKCINLPRAILHWSITKHIDHCDRNNKHYHLHVHIKCIVILLMRLVFESRCNEE